MSSTRKDETHELRPIRRAFVPYVDALAVIDSDADMTFLAHEHVREWGVSVDQVLDVALQNLLQHASTDVELNDDLHGPLYVLSTNDGYEASRLLLPGWLASFRGKVEGEPIAIVPQRGLVFIDGSARPEMVSRLVEMADREFCSSPRNISPALYTVDGSGSVVPYVSKSLPCGSRTRSSRPSSIASRPKC